MRRGYMISAIKSKVKFNCVILGSSNVIWLPGDIFPEWTLECGVPERCIHLRPDPEKRQRLLPRPPVPSANPAAPARVRGGGGGEGVHVAPRERQDFLQAGRGGRAAAYRGGLFNHHVLVGMRGGRGRRLGGGRRRRAAVVGVGPSSLLHRSSG